MNARLFHVLVRPVMSFILLQDKPVVTRSHGFDGGNKQNCAPNLKLGFQRGFCN